MKNSYLESGNMFDYGEIYNIVSNIPTGIGVFTVGENDVRLIFLNDVYYKSLRRERISSESYMTGGFMSYLLPEDRPVIDRGINEVRIGNNYSANIRLIDGDGNYIWFRMDINNIGKDENKRRVCYISFLNIDNSKQAEEQYNESVQFLKFAAENSISYHVISITTRRVIHTQSSIDNWPLFDGAVLSEDLFAKLCNLYIPDRFQRDNYYNTMNVRAMRKYYENGITTLSTEFRMEESGRKNRWVSSKATILRSPVTGELEAHVFTEDIDRRVMLELMFKRIGERSYDFIVLFDAASGILREVYDGLNTISDSLDHNEPVLLQLLKLSDKEQVIKEDKDNESYYGDIEDIYAKIESDEEYVFMRTLYDKEGRLKYENHTLFYFDDTKETICYIRQNITEMRKKEIEQQKKLLDAMEEATRANNAKTDFLSRMSHEIRTPLNAIIGMTKLAYEDDNMGTVKNYINKINKSSEFLLSIINDILDVSRIESGKFNLDYSWNDPRDIYMPCIDMMIPQMKNKEINFIWNADDNTYNNTEFFYDPVRCRQIIMNLLNNAYKFTDMGGTIEVICEHVRYENDLSIEQFTVKDTGCGISKLFIPHLFKAFEQEHNTYQSSQQGTGLGLSIVKQIIDKMGGTITVRSELNKGSEFIVTLPFRWRKGTTNKERKRNIVTLQDVRILVAEDNSINAEITLKLLQKAGAKPELAINGLETVDKFKSSPEEYYDAILMDVRMPIMDGIEATKKIRQLNRTDALAVPIIAYTADVFTEDMERTRLAGMNAHLSKPIDPDVMCKVIAGCISKNVN